MTKSPFEFKDNDPNKFNWPADIIPVAGFLLMFIVILRGLVYLTGVFNDNWDMISSAIWNGLWFFVFVVGFFAYVLGGHFAGWGRR